MNPSTSPIRVLVADDQDLVRMGLLTLLQAEPGLEPVGDVADGLAAVAEARRTRPDVVLMDIRMPGIDGLEATRRIVADPELAETKVLVLAIFPRGENKDDAKRKVNEGANAIIQKMADGKMVHYLDIGPKFLAADGTLSKEVMPDLLHLNEGSYRTWAESIEPKVKELLGEK